MYGGIRMSVLVSGECSQAVRRAWCWLDPPGRLGVQWLVKCLLHMLTWICWLTNLFPSLTAEKWIKCFKGLDSQQERYFTEVFGAMIGLSKEKQRECGSEKCVVLGMRNYKWEVNCIKVSKIRRCVVWTSQTNKYNFESALCRLEFAFFIIEIWILYYSGHDRSKALLCSFIQQYNFSVKQWWIWILRLSCQWTVLTSRKDLHCLGKYS